MQGHASVEAGHANLSTESEHLLTYRAAELVLTTSTPAGLSTHTAWLVRYQSPDGIVESSTANAFQVLASG